ncbi:MAG: PKD domain-containing protein [Sandaracinus sp.]|nr:PKD domain-containing protein [Sandaracinus sp.]
MRRAFLLAFFVTACDCGGTPRVPVDAAGDASPDAPSLVGDAATDAPNGDGALVDGGEPSDGGMPPGRVCADTETCYDGTDDDCDGRVEEGCPCSPGETQACFGGDPMRRGLGACLDGMQVCEGGEEFGTWSECTGDVIEAAEVCDVDGVDESCDGASNEGCECVGEGMVSCGSDVGACIPGLQACVDGMRTACEGAVGPTVERCNGLDDDCDGATDEGVRRTCGSDVGACRPGVERCVDGAFTGLCEGGNAARDEACDGLDDDCDGSVDEGVMRLCGSDEGRCVAGIERCTDGTFAACEGRIDPIAETCNGADDDCDGATDESLTRSCGTSDLGVCRRGTETCSAGVFGACVGAVLPGSERCDGASDEDCDGVIDEGCACTDGATRSCGTDVGACVAGTETCAGGVWGACDGRLDPRAESCNGADDDCDGRTDETLVRSCGITDVGACSLGTETCAAGTWGTCTGRVDPTTELCEGSVDENCDGTVDEGCLCTNGQTRPCGSDVGACMRGTQTCSAAGAWGACTGEVRPSAERCDGSVDDDCDGAVDEGCDCTTGATRRCGSDVGACVAGTETCSAAGTWGACVGRFDGGPESCNAADDDCDGRTDETLVRSCGTDVGACVAGTQSCASGSWGSCSDVGPTAERCDGSIDENCNGSVDEGCLCTNGQTRRCGTDVGACVAGTETCNLSGAWGSCVGAVGASAERCNGVDDDCDSRTDEGSVCRPPTLTCPMGASTLVGTTVMLTGSGSDPDGGSVSFAWTVVSAPGGSSALPSPANAATTSFRPDAVGSYVLRLCVTDDEGQTACCTTSVTASSACTPPSAPTPTTCPTSWDRRPVVEVPALPSGVVYQLFLDGSGSPYATVTTTGQNYHRPSSALAAGSAPPGTLATIGVRACRSDDLTCCSAVQTTTTRLVETCTTPIAPTPDNLIFSEYVIDGDGACPGADCQAGEAIELVNLSHCPLALEGNHFGYQNAGGTTFRWMDFGAADVVPPRGVYVAIRNLAASMCDYPFFGPDDPSLFGLRISQLEMQGTNLSGGWFSNSGGGASTLRLATGAWVDITSGMTLDVISPYTASPECSSRGFDAFDACGNPSALTSPTETLTPNQLGRLWHPCDAVVDPVPASCR